jgi:hypothetical protein
MEEYRDRDLRAVASKRISAALNIPRFGPAEMLVKLKNLRSSYCQELKKIALSKRSGKPTDEVYKQKVVWVEKMNFQKQFYPVFSTSVQPPLNNHHV